MDTLYPATVGTVNLSTGAASLLRWLYRWHSQTGDVHPSTSYLARKQGKSERTIYRWLSELRQVGAIACEVAPGVSRQVVPLVVPPPAPKRRRSVPGLRQMSGVVSRVVSGVMSGVLSSNTDALTQETSTHTGPGLVTIAKTEQEGRSVVASLIAEGVTPPVAARLVLESGSEVAREQVEALPFRKPRDRAAVLVQSIRQRWAVPVALEASRETRRQEAKRAERARVVAVAAADREKGRQDLLARLSGLSTAQREALEARALAMWQEEQPAAARLMAGRSMAGAVVQGYVLRLISAEGGEVA